MPERGKRQDPRGIAAQRREKRRRRAIDEEDVRRAVANSVNFEKIRTFAPSADKNHWKP
ncbi:unnamed protein product [Ectocarpus sp. CCAP 1310/34]|nr:unnamed protein product [Ectocarpus sp. CCAP 1310/34]